MRVFIFFLVVFTFSCMTQASSWPTLDTTAKQAIIMDFASGDILFEKNPDEITTPSSMTKMMTTYLVFKKLKAGLIKMNTLLPISEVAWKMGGSKMFVHVGDQVSISDLLKGIIIQSGNDACIVVAEGLAGTVSAFAKAMTDEARRLGATNTTFKNPNGYPEEGHISTVRDLAIIGLSLIRDFPEPEYYGLHAQQEFTYNNITQQNRNPLLKKGIGCDGIKTGHTENGGFGIVATVLQDGKRIILVINGLASEKERAEESIKLISWAMRTFGSYRLFSAKDVVKKDIPVAMGNTYTIDAIVEGDVAIALPQEWSSRIKTEIRVPNYIKAPLKQGTIVGELIVSIPGRENPKSYPLVVPIDIAQGSLWKRIRDSLYLWLTGHV